MKLVIKTSAVDNGDYEAVLDAIDTEAAQTKPGESRTVNIELEIQNDETEVEDETEKETD